MRCEPSARGQVTAAHPYVTRHYSVTSRLKNCRNQNMQNQIRYVRLALTALGLWTVRACGVREASLWEGHRDDGKRYLRADRPHS